MAIIVANCVALSTAEVEFIATKEAFRELLGMKKLLNGLALQQKKL